MRPRRWRLVHVRRILGIHLRILAIESRDNDPLVALVHNPFTPPRKQPLFRGTQSRRPRRHQPAVVPSQSHGSARTLGREIHVHDRRFGIHVFHRLTRRRLHRNRRIQTQDLEDPSEAVTPHVAIGSAAEIEPAAPHERQIRLVIRAFRCRTHPHIPVKSRRRRHRLGRTQLALRPERPTGPVVHRAHSADGAVFDPLLDRQRRVRVRIIHRHRRRHAFIARRRSHAPRLAHRVRHRFLPQHMLALAHRRQPDWRMPVIGRRDIHRVEALLFLQQLAEIPIRRASRALVVRIHEPLRRTPAAHAQTRLEVRRQVDGSRRLEIRPPLLIAGTQQLPRLLHQRVVAVLNVIETSGIHIAHREDAHLRFREQVHHHVHALPPESDASDGHLVARRHLPGSRHHMPRHDEERRRGSRGRASHEIPPSRRHHYPFLSTTRSTIAFAPSTVLTSSANCSSPVRFGAP